MGAFRPLTPLEERHAAALARWFRLQTDASQARTGRALRRLRAELAEVERELAELEHLLESEARP